MASGSGSSGSGGVGGQGHNRGPKSGGFSGRIGGGKKGAPSKSSKHHAPGRPKPGRGLRRG